MPDPWVCQMTPPSRLRQPLLRQLHADELVLPGDLLDARIEDHEVTHQVEQPVLAQHLRNGAVEKRTRHQIASRRHLVAPFDEQRFGRSDRAVAQALRIAAGQHKLRGGEERRVENLVLVGNQLPDAVADFDRGAFQFDHRDGEAVEVDDQIGAPFVATLQGHLFGEGEVVGGGVFPVDQVHRLVRGGDRGLHIDAVAQQRVGAQVGLIERGAGHLDHLHQARQGGVDLVIGIAAGREVRAQQVRLDATVVRAARPVAKVPVAETALVLRRGDVGREAVLRDAFAAGTFRHAPPPTHPTPRPGPAGARGRSARPASSPA